MLDLQLPLWQFAAIAGFTLPAFPTVARSIRDKRTDFSAPHTILLKPYPWSASERQVYAAGTYSLLGLQEAVIAIPDGQEPRNAA
jgi:hypothetical protein